jgi:hypothetical protein
MHGAYVGAPKSISAALDCFYIFCTGFSFSYSFNYSRSEIVKRFLPSCCFLKVNHAMPASLRELHFIVYSKQSTWLMGAIFLADFSLKFFYDFVSNNQYCSEHYKNIVKFI